MPRIMMLQMAERKRRRLRNACGMDASNSILAVGICLTGCIPPTYL
jgi:hypothetical protein